MPTQEDTESAHGESGEKSLRELLRGWREPKMFLKWKENDLIEQYRMLVLKILARNDVLSQEIIKEKDSNERLNQKMRNESRRDTDERGNAQEETETPQSPHDPKAMEKELVVLRDKLAEKITEIAEERTEIERLNGEVERLETTVDEHDRGVQDLQKKLDERDDRVMNLEKQLEERNHNQVCAFRASIEGDANIASHSLHRSMTPTLENPPKMILPRERSKLNCYGICSTPMPPSLLHSLPFLP